MKHRWKGFGYCECGARRVVVQEDCKRACFISAEGLWLGPKAPECTRKPRRGAGMKQLPLPIEQSNETTQKEHTPWPQTQPRRESSN